MNTCTNHLYLMSFTVGAESGLAFVSAPSESGAESLLRNTGKYNGCPQSYEIVQTRDIGMASSIRNEVLLESYVNALVAYDAMLRVLQNAKGPKGDKGDPGDGIYELAVKYGFFYGTEEEFTQQYEDLLEACREATTAANTTNENVIQAESIRVLAENARIAAELERVAAEILRQAESARAVLNADTAAGGARDAQSSIEASELLRETIFLQLKAALENAFASVDNLVNELREFPVIFVQALPEASESTMRKFYLMPSPIMEGVYDIYMSHKVDDSYLWRKVGGTNISFTEYLRKDDIIHLTEDAYDALLDPDPTKYYMTYEDEEEQP